MKNGQWQSERPRRNGATRSSRFGRAFGVGLAVLVSGIIGVFALGVLVSLQGLPSFAEVRSAHRPSDVWLLDRTGAPLESIRTGANYRSLDWVTLSDVSPAFIRMVIGAEDRRFYRHAGVDLMAIGGAARSAFADRAVRGASTITMQLVKGFDAGAQASKSDFNKLASKFTQMAHATALEMIWSKEEILEAYINRVSFRGEVVGLKAASHGYFGKSPLALGETESAILTAILRAPNAEKRIVGRRACAMLSVEFCTDIHERLDDVFEKGFQVVRSRNLVPVVSKAFLTDKMGGATIRTTLDASVQKMTMELMHEQLSHLKGQNVQDAAVLVLETRTGHPVAYAANGGPGFTSASQVDGIQSRRQMGSTIKPFVYAEAYELDVLTTTSLLNDSPEIITISEGQVYQPRNYDNLFRGAVGAAEALASSLNVPAVRTLDLVGETRVLSRLQSLGFSKLLSAGMYGPSLALGTVDATLWEVANGYRHLSLYSGTNKYTELTKRRIFESLSVPENRRLTFGVQNILQLPFPAAVKTGTSKDMRDNWCIGFTSEYTVAVWVGNFDGKPMWNVSGMSGAAPLWRRLMLALHKNRNPEDPRMYYQTPDRPIPKKSISRIRYPVRDMMIGIDPDIPVKMQKVPLSVEGPTDLLSFFINGRKFAMATGSPLWSPTRGRHVFELRDGRGDVLDSVQVVVR